MPDSCSHGLQVTVRLTGQKEKPRISVTSWKPVAGTYSNPGLAPGVQAPETTSVDWELITPDPHSKKCHQGGLQQMAENSWRPLSRVDDPADR